MNHYSYVPTYYIFSVHLIVFLQKSKKKVFVFFISKTSIHTWESLLSRVDKRASSLVKCSNDEGKWKNSLVFPRMQTNLYSKRRKKILCISYVLYVKKPRSIFFLPQNEAVNCTISDMAIVEIDSYHFREWINIWIIYHFWLKNRQNFICNSKIYFFFFLSSLFLFFIKVYVF